MTQATATGEEELLRRAMLILVALSALSGPRTFAAAPVDVSATTVVTNTGILVVLLAALWRRLMPAGTTALVAATTGGTAGLIVFRDVILAVVAGTVSIEAAGNVALAAIVSVSGVAFVGLRIRGAIIVSLAVIVGHVVVVLVAGGDQGTTLLTDRGIAQSIRFGMTGVALFLVVAVVSVARARERDASERARREALARAANLEAAAAVRRRMHEDAAHELKGPLAIICAAAETLHERRGELAPGQEDAIFDTLRRAVERLDSRILDTVLSSAELDFRAAPVDLEGAVALDAALREVAAMVPVGSLEVRAAPGTCVRVHPDELRHVLENLLSNAVKYGSPGAPVLVELHGGAHDVVVSVTSRGNAMAVHERGRVFDRNYRVAGSDDHAEGQGVGLAIVRQLVTGWGCRVWCDGDEDRTTFSFTLPRPN